MGFGNYTGKNKYGASKVTFMGMVFDSRFERDRYLYLADLQRHGKISGLRRQVKFTLLNKTIKIVEKQLKTKTKMVEKVVELPADYHCDFLYKEDGSYIIEEFKSKMTAQLPDYILRRKMMVKKVYEHNNKGRSFWVFREVVYSGNSITITDK